jgi:hypothetical protein
MATQYGITDPDHPYTVDTSHRHGLAGGLLIYFPITESFGIQQEFLYVQKGSRQEIDMNPLPIKTFTDYDINYFEIPVVFRYTFVRLGKFKIYGCSGFALSILMNGESRLKMDTEFEGVPITISQKEKIEGLDTFDYSFIYGSGVDFKLFGQDCFFEYRFTIGWNTLMMPTFEGEDPAPLRNQDYTFTLGMYF